MGSEEGSGESDEGRDFSCSFAEKRSTEIGPWLVAIVVKGGYFTYILVREETGNG